MRILTSNSFKSVVKQSYDRIRESRYHSISNTIAKKTLGEIEKEKGKLSSTLKKRADKYAVSVLGWKGYAPWLYVYSHISGEFKEGWIPDNYYGKVVIPKIQGDYGRISFLKPLTNIVFDERITPDLAYFINGHWFDSSFKHISSSSLAQLLFATDERVIHKLDQSYQGKGIFIYDRNTFTFENIELKGNGVLQKFIRQHAFFNEFTPNAVATIRITTVVDNEDNITIRACYLRLGRHHDTHVKSDSHIRIPIELQNGALLEDGYLANWQLIKAHPDSKIAFHHKIIPNFIACTTLVLQLHQKMPMVRTIGWDMIIDHQENPVVMEWNGYSNDIKFSEATQGPCFKDLGWENLRISL